MEKRHLGRYDKSGIEKLYKLFSNSMATKDAAAILGVSTTSVQAYYKIFNDLHAGKVIETSKHAYCESAVKAFCEAHGFTYRHISDEQPPEAATEAPAEAAQEDGEDQKEFYRFNAKLPAECEEYLKEMAWRNRCTITEYLTRLVIADEKKETGDQLPGQIGMDEITQAAATVKATGEKPEAIRNAEDELIRTFEKYIWLLTGTFLNARTAGGEKK